MRWETLEGDKMHTKQPREAAAVAEEVKQATLRTSNTVETL